MANISFVSSALFGVQDFCSAIEGVNTGDVCMILYMWFCVCVYMLCYRNGHVKFVFHRYSRLWFTMLKKLTSHLHSMLNHSAPVILSRIYLIRIETSFIIMASYPCPIIINTSILSFNLHLILVTFQIFWMLMMKQTIMKTRVTMQLMQETYLCSTIVDGLLEPGFKISYLDIVTWTFLYARNFSCK
jgi:hypothetical protein